MKRLTKVMACRIALETLAMQAGALLAAQREQIFSWCHAAGAAQRWEELEQQHCAATAGHGMRQSADPSMDHMQQASQHESTAKFFVCQLWHSPVSAQVMSLAG